MKKIFITLVMFGLLISPTFVDAQQKGIHEPGTGLEDPALKESMQGTGQGLQDQNEMSILRRNRVANTVQEIEKIANRNQSIGNQIRVIAQNQNKIQEEAENALQTAQKRGNFSRFLIGPNYGQLKTVEDRLENHNQNLTELKELSDQIENEEDSLLLDQQISIMEEIKIELEEAVSEDQKGFSLFGWFNRFLLR